MKSEIVVALVGNPNCGKTSLFNALTGSKQHVGNWPGVTVEKKEGKLTFQGKELRIVDLPGTYSLGAYSEDEVVARNFILKEKPDVVVNVIDSTNIERNLYLTVQLMEMNSNVVLALNMADEAESKNIFINHEKLSKSLCVPAIPTIAPKKKGIEELLKKVVESANSKGISSTKMKYGKELEGELKVLSDSLDECAAELDYPSEWTAIKLLENDEYIINNLKEKGCFDKLSNKLKKSIENITASIGYEPDAAIVDKRYEFITESTKGCVKKDQENKETWSDKIDKVVTHKIGGLVIFAAIMFLMYQITMAFGNDFLGGYVDEGFGALGDWASGALANSPELLQSFVIDGIIGGLGSVLVFIPLILVMYMIISILEETGYMARAAYVMDRFMQSIGLHGKTAVSMIIGSGCNVAGIMATRTLESKKDRMIAILINPFVSCATKMEIYGVFVGAFFAGKKFGIFNAGGFIVFTLYVIGIIIAILSAKLFSKYLFKGESSYFVMELPPYRVPSVKGVLIHMWEKASAFVKRAGTIIFAVVVLIWFLSVMPLGVEPGTAESILGKMGSFIAPIFKPLGFGTWQAAVSLITGVLAKEAVVGTMATVFAVSEGSLETAIQSQFTALSSYAFMIFCLLYAPCVAAIGAIRRETNSHKWALFSVLYSTTVAWIAAFLVYNVGGLFIK
jgi:ferrous iron transport protein B